MLPFFADLNCGVGVAGTRAAVQVPPPPGFQALLLPLKAAAFGNWTRTQTGLTASQKAGLRFEKKVHLALREKYNYMYHESQVLEFTDQRGGGRCIPDGLLKLSDCIVIIEIKSQHMPESWWQLRRKYEPIIRFMFPDYSVLLLEVCKSLDAAMPYPERFEVVEEINAFISTAPDGALGVLQWKL